MKLSNNNNNMSSQKEISSQPPEIPPPRISEKNFKMSSVDTYVEAPIGEKNDESFADFSTQFPHASSKVSIMVNHLRNSLKVRIKLVMKAESL